MAYITPNSIVILLEGVPLDNTYQHTVNFANKDLQYSAFVDTYSYQLYSQQMYVRSGKNSVRVYSVADEVLKYNYMIFQNSAFGSKWFYAFITKVDYINNNVTEITFEIDDFQTWMFDYTLEPSFIEREHANSDEIGDNLVPENLEHGEYICDDVSAPYEMNPKSVIVAATFDENYQNATGGIYNGLYSGLVFHKFPASNPQAVSDFINGAGAKLDGIVSVFLVPSVFAVEGSTNPSFTHEKTKYYANVRDDGRPVKNNKVHTSPYNTLYVSNNQGNTAEFPYEYFNSDSCVFEIAGDYSCSPSVMLYPRNYKGLAANLDEKIILTGFPQLAWSGDTFKAWIAQHGASLAVGAVSTAFGAAGAQQRYLASWNNPNISVEQSLGSGYMMAAGLAMSIGQTCATIYEHSLAPRQAHSGVGSTLLAANSMLTFTIMNKHIRPEFVTIIDDYFSMFGYATHRVKRPNVNGRRYWNYVKTVGCNIVGSMPSGVASHICSIYDKGVTIWHDLDAVSNYNLDNAIVGGDLNE